MSSLTTRLPSHLSRRAFLTGTAATTGLLLTGAALLETAPAQASTSLAWGNFANGRIVASRMSRIAGGSYLRADAAAAYAKMAAAFTREFHTPLSVTQGYRSIGEQVTIFEQRYDRHKTNVKNSVRWSGLYWTLRKGQSIAAVPGTSIHGWALAVDFWSGVQKPGSPQKKWADKNGPRFNWLPVGNGFGEAWHFEYRPAGLK